MRDEFAARGSGLAKVSQSIIKSNSKSNQSIVSVIWRVSDSCTEFHLHQISWYKGIICMKKRHFLEQCFLIYSSMKCSNLTACTFLPSICFSGVSRFDLVRCSQMMWSCSDQSYLQITVEEWNWQRWKEWIYCIGKTTCTRDKWVTGSVLTRDCYLTAFLIGYLVCFIKFYIDKKCVNVT